MSLEALAAVLCPRDMAMHPNYPDDAYDQTLPARLAALIMGGPFAEMARRRQPYADAAQSKDDLLLREIAAAFQLETTRVSAGELTSRLAALGRTELPLAVAVGLIASLAWTEAEEPKACLDLLETLLAKNSGANEDELLLRAVTLQQLALRQFDFRVGEPTKQAGTAIAILRSLDVSRISPFNTGPGVAWTYIETLQNMMAGLVDSALSLLPPESVATEDASERVWSFRLRQPRNYLAMTTATGESDALNRLLTQLFRGQFDMNTRTLGGVQAVDLFPTQLLAEFYGHRDSLRLRQAVATLRLLDSGSPPEQIADCLRLLRQALANKELDTVLTRLVEGGPLTALATDARRILGRTRSLDVTTLGTPEMRVLGMAADVLTSVEAKIGYGLVRNLLIAGGPTEGERAQELPVLRLASAWRAAASLAVASGQETDFAEYMLSASLALTHHDQLLDQSVAQALGRLDWAHVEVAVRDGWLEGLSRALVDMTTTAEEVFSALGHPDPPGNLGAVPAIVYRLNLRLSDPDASAIAASQEVYEALGEQLDLTRRSAAAGSSSGGGLNYAEILTGLLLEQPEGSATRWAQLSDFITDDRVQRQDKARAMERLARSTAVLPRPFTQALLSKADSLLSQTGALNLFGSTAQPFPAALRLLSGHELLPENRVLECLASLISQTAQEAGGPEEAARTIALLATKGNRSSWLTALGLVLSRSEQPRTRAYAAQALGVSSREDVISSVVVERLRELLGSGGVLVPLVVLRALNKMPESIATRFSVDIRDLGEVHMARSVRREAQRSRRELLRRQPR